LPRQNLLSRRQKTMSTFSDPDSLDDLTLRAGTDIRHPLLQTLVDLYLQKPTHTAEEAHHFTELTLRLLDQADALTREAVRQRLESYPSVPPAIMERLAGETLGERAFVETAEARATPAAAPAPSTPAAASSQELSELFFAANATERRLILLNLAYAPEPVTAVAAGNPTEAARQLEAAALSHNAEAFVRALERWFSIGTVLARRITQDPLGEPIVVVAKALGMAPEVLQRILLFVNPLVGHSVSRVYELAALFTSIDIRAAQTLAGIWRTAEPRSTMRPIPPGAADTSARRTAAPRANTSMAQGAVRPAPSPARSAG